MSGDLSFLFGKWVGGGRGRYPTVDDFEYSEEMNFTDAGDGLIVYDEGAWDPGTKDKIHSEFGYLRMHDDATLDFTLAYPFGVSETMKGTVEGGTLSLESVSMSVAPEGEPVTKLSRRIEVAEDTLVYEILMETPKQPMARHLRGTLTRS